MSIKNPGSSGSGGGGTGTVTSVGITSTGSSISVTGSPVTTAGNINVDIAANGVTNADLAQMAAKTIKGNNTTGTANAADLTVAQLQSLIAMPMTLAQSGIPFVVPSSGSMANNGAITLTTALSTTYANAFMFLPANAISAGSTAGWYFTQMSSTTVGTVFNNTYTSGQPVIPTPVAFSTTGPGAYTQSPTGSDIAAIVVPVSGNSMGVNGAIEAWMVNTNINSAGAKKVTLYFGGTSVGVGSQTTSTAAAWIRSVRNRGIATAQVAITNTSGDVQAGSGVFLTKDTTTTQNVEIRLQIAAATDYVVLESFSIKIIPN